MGSSSWIEVIDVTKTWYDNMFPDYVEAVRTVTDKTDEAMFTSEVRYRHDKMKCTIKAMKLSDACQQLSRKHKCEHVAVVTPTLFDKNNLSKQEYELAISSYYCSVIREFDMENIEYRYDLNLPVSSKDGRQRIDALSYRKFSRIDPNIDDVISRVQSSFVIPAKYGTDILIVDGWNASTMGYMIRKTALAYREMIKKYPHLYRRVFFALSNPTVVSIFADVIFGDNAW